jgi:hypothetical protein
MITFFHVIEKLCPFYKKNMHHDGPEKISKNFLKEEDHYSPMNKQGDEITYSQNTLLTKKPSDGILLYED